MIKRKTTTVLGSGPYKPVLPCTRVVSYFPLLHLGVIAVSMKNAVSAHTTVAVGRAGRWEPQNILPLKGRSGAMAQTQEKALSSFTVYQKIVHSSLKNFLRE